MEGPIGRQRRTKAERAQIAAEGLVPGTSVTEVARRNGTTRWQVYDWRKKLWEPSTHVRDPGRQPDPRVARHRDHVIRPSTSPRTDASAVGPSTTTRRPSDSVMSTRCARTESPAGPCVSRSGPGSGSGQHERRPCGFGTWRGVPRTGRHRSQGANDPRLRWAVRN